MNGGYSANGPRSWLVLVLGDDRTYAGNDGYDDEVTRFYSWNSRVANSSVVAVDDRLVLWNKKSLLGHGTISRIETAEGTANQRFCPFCTSSDIRFRKTKKPDWRCQDCLREFDDVVESTIDVMNYRAHYSQTWVPLYGALSATEVRPLALSPRSQHSIREMNWSAFQKALETKRWS